MLCELSQQVGSAAASLKCTHSATLAHQSAQSVVTHQEEAEQVTRKLRKLWAKYTEAKGELDGAWGEWAGEKEEMLDSVRMLQQQLTLKDLVIQAFVPPEDVQKVRLVTDHMNTVRALLGSRQEQQQQGGGKELLKG